jgi:hypothetical protein
VALPYFASTRRKYSEGLWPHLRCLQKAIYFKHELKISLKRENFNCGEAAYFKLLNSLLEPIQNYKSNDAF